MSAAASSTYRRTSGVRIAVPLIRSRACSIAASSITGTTAHQGRHLPLASCERPLDGGQFFVRKRMRESLADGTQVLSAARADDDLCHSFVSEQPAERETRQ